MLKQLEDWLLSPWKNDIPLIVLAGFGVIFVVVCVWATDGLRLLKRMT